MAATSCGFAATAGSNSSSSRWIDVEVLTGSRPDAPETSTRWIEHLGPLDVAQELVAEAVAFVRALDQAGHIGDDEAAVVAQRDHAQVRRERRERVVGDLRTRRGDARDQRGLAGVGESDQADVSDQLQLQAQIPLFARLAWLGPPRRAIGRRDEPRIATPAASALGDEEALALRREVGEEPRLVPGSQLSRNWRAERHLDLEVLSRLAGLVRALAVLAASCLELGVKAEIDERVLRGSRDDVDGTAARRRRRRRDRRAGRISRV